MKHLYQTLADLVLLLHALFVVFVVAALLLTVVGGYCHWQWIRNWWFRVIHFLGIAVVIVKSWAGLICSITTFEMWLRRQAGGELYDGSFIQYWLQRFLYYGAPGWGFTVVYTGFGLLVIITWIRFPPLRKSGASSYPIQ